MKKNWKRILALAVAVVLVLGTTVYMSDFTLKATDGDGQQLAQQEVDNQTDEIDLSAGTDEEVQEPEQAEEPQAEEETPVVEETGETSEEPEVTEEPEKQETVKEEEPEVTEKPEEVKEPVMPAQAPFTLTSDGARVTVTAPEGALPEGCTVTAEPVEGFFKERKIEKAVENAIGGQNKEMTGFKAYDITILDSEENEIQPEVPVNVSIAGTDFGNGTIEIYHIDSNDEAELVGICGASAVSFEAEGFSVYVAAEIAPSRDGLDVEDGDTITMKKGEVIKVNAQKSKGGNHSWSVKDDSVAKLKNNANEWNEITAVGAGSTDVYYTYHEQDKSKTTIVIHINVIDSYKITYVLNGGTNAEANPESCTMGTELVLADPVREGYDFAGWFADEDFEDPVTGIDADNSKDITVYAKWTVEKFDVTFDSDGGSAVEAQSVEKGSKAALPEAPVKEGYDFVCWNLDGSEYDFNTEVTGALNLVAQWQLKEYAVTFNSNGGSEVAAQTVAHGTATVKPEDPAKDGYSFEGWFTDEELTEMFGFATPVTEETTLYAKWEQLKTVTINYYKDSTDSEPIATETKEGFRVGAEVELTDEEIQANKPNGYTDAANPGKYTVTKDGAVIDVVYYKDTTVVYVYLKAQGSFDKTKLAEMGITSNKDGWFTIGKSYVTGVNPPADEDIDVLAAELNDEQKAELIGENLVRFDKNKDFELRPEFWDRYAFKVCNGATDYANETKIAGTNKHHGAYHYNGYITFYKVKYTDGASNVEVFPDMIQDTLWSYDDAESFGDDPVREGYRFDGWKESVSGTTKTYTAKWTQIADATINYYADSTDGELLGTETLEDQVVGQYIPVADVNKFKPESGYLNGEYTKVKVTADGENVVNVVYKKNTTTVYLYLQVNGDASDADLAKLGLTKVNKHGWYTIGKAGLAGVDKPEIGKKVKLSADLKKQLFANVEKYTEANTEFVVKASYFGDTISATQGATDYAGETGSKPTYHLNGLLDVYKITYVNGEDVAENVAAGGGDMPAYEGSLEKEGYIFLGWNDGEKTISSDKLPSVVTGDATYTAKYRKIHTLTVNYADKETGKILATSTFTDENDLKVNIPAAFRDANGNVYNIADINGNEEIAKKKNEDGNIEITGNLGEDVTLTVNYMRQKIQPVSGPADPEDNPGDDPADPEEEVIGPPIDMEDLPLIDDIDDINIHKEKDPAAETDTPAVTITANLDGVGDTTGTVADNTTAKTTDKGIEFKSIADEDTPLANTVLEDVHCILHWIILLIALICGIVFFVTNNKLRRELENR